MNGTVDVTEGRQVLGRLSRSSQEKAEVSVVTSPGARASAWPVKVVSHSSYNVYNIHIVVIGEAGSLPVGIGQQMQAFNLAESFIDEGQLPAGTYAIMFKVGERNIFYAPV